MGKNVLLVSGSAQGREASSYQLAQQVVEKFEVSELKIRDLSTGLASINYDWVSANFADQTERSEAQNDTLRQSDELIAELTWADIVVIAAPIYNFGVPSALKAWVDYVCRAGLTFNYTETGPVGLLSGKRAILAITSGGVPVDSPVDFTTPHLRQVLNFIGISEIQTVRADQQVTTADFMDRANSDLLAIG